MSGLQLSDAIHSLRCLFLGCKSTEKVYKYLKADLYHRSSFPNKFVLMSNQTGRTRIGTDTLREFPKAAGPMPQRDLHILSGHEAPSPVTNIVLARQ